MTASSDQPLLQQNGSLRAGDVLVVGSGQSGSQIAEDLYLAGSACTPLRRQRMALSRASSLRDDLRANLDAADEVSENIKRSIDGFIAKREVEALAEAPYMPVWQPAGETAALHDRDALANLATTHCELGDWLA